MTPAKNMGLNNLGPKRNTGRPTFPLPVTSQYFPKIAQRKGRSPGKLWEHRL